MSQTVMMKRWIINEYMAKNSSLEFDMIGYGDQRRAFLAKIYDEHTHNVREFVKRHPSHRLIEVNITDPNAGKIMSNAFGLSETCWGHKNKKEEHDKIADKVVGALSQGKYLDVESEEDIPASSVDFKKKLPLSLPVIVVGYPKSGRSTDLRAHIIPFFWVKYLLPVLSRIRHYKRVQLLLMFGCRHPALLCIWGYKRCASL
jgi:hypothetical protein